MPEIASAVALGELERLEELVEMRKACAQILDDVVKSCSWIKPQVVPDGYINSYWTYAAYLTDGAPDWAAFRAKFVELGGDGFYGC
jgi:perosamine synthetase